MAELENNKDLMSVLWSGADILRSKMDANEYKTYLLAFVFYKYLSDSYLVTVYDLLNDSKPNDLIEAQKEYEKIFDSEDAGELLEELKESLHYTLDPDMTFTYMLNEIEKAYPEYEIIEKLRQYDFSKQRRLSFEYIMFRGLNDSLRHAEELVRLLKGLHCRINLIRFHAIPDVALRTSDESSMVQFRNYLTRKGIICTIRSSRGEDIFAACGMLSTARTQKVKLRE